MNYKPGHTLKEIPKAKPFHVDYQKYDKNSNYTHLGQLRTSGHIRNVIRDKLKCVHTYINLQYFASRQAKSQEIVEVYGGRERERERQTYKLQ